MCFAAQPASFPPDRLPLSLRSDMGGQMFKVASMDHVTVRAEMRALALPSRFPVVQIGAAILTSACLISVLGTLFSY
jgi:hypothetical protein